MSRRPTIAAAVVALNEAHQLSSLLESLSWVDEIVVVDGGSRDETASIARRYGCRTVVRAFDRFECQRNHAASMAGTDWVLSIDADERPSAALPDEVRRRMEQSRATAFRVPIRSRIFGRRFRFSGTQDDRPIRLFRRNAAHWVGGVHEVLRVDGRVERLNAWLDHETLPDLAAFLAKMQRYTALEARSRVEAGQKPRREEAWLAPVREVFRRLIWKQGWLDGPEGWAFCALSGLSAWVQVVEHHRAWTEYHQRAATTARPEASSALQNDAMNVPTMAWNWLGRAE